MRELGTLLVELDTNKVYAQARALKKSIPVDGNLTCEMASNLQTRFALITAELSWFHKKD